MKRQTTEPRGENCRFDRRGCRSTRKLKVARRVSVIWSASWR